MVSSPIHPLKDLVTSTPINFYDSTDVLIGTDINPPKISPSKSVTKRIKILYWLQIISTIILIILIVLFFVYIHSIYEWMESYITLIEQQGVFFAPIVYLLTCYLCIILLIPQTLITIFGGFIFVKLLGLKGIITAIFIVWFGCSLGSTQSFCNSRYIYQNIQYLKNILIEFNQYEQIYNALKGKENYDKNGFKLILIMRLIPWTPYNIFNLSIATTKIRLIHFIYACIGMLPDVIMYCFIGAFIDSISRIIYNDNSNDWASVVFIFTLIGSAVSIFGIIYIGKISYTKYNNILNETSNALQKQKAFPTRYSISSDSATIKDVSLPSNVSDFM
eukprot:221775_1